MKGFWKFYSVFLLILSVLLFFVIMDFRRQFERINEAAAMKQQIIDLCYAWNKRHLIESQHSSAYKWAYHDLPPLMQIVNSGKEIKMENFLEPDIIIRLNK